METVKTWRDSPTGPETGQTRCCECDIWQGGGDDEYAWCAIYQCETHREDGC